MRRSTSPFCFRTIRHTHHAGPTSAEAFIVRLYREKEQERLSEGLLRPTRAHHKRDAAAPHDHERVATPDCARLSLVGTLSCKRCLNSSGKLRL
ncbi:hypothetical protein FKP32DRAFT_87421 [Trametes sanguinea]|nr:hypothetical protein FKP32DRAFT_87421 [Trametes sanguinea]